MKLLLGETGKVKIGTSGKLGDKDCCCVFECPAVFLICDTVSASLTKCGFAPIYNAYTYPYGYLKFEWTVCDGIGTGSTQLDFAQRFFTITHTLNGCAEAGVTCPTSGTYTEVESQASDGSCDYSVTSNGALILECPPDDCTGPECPPPCQTGDEIIGCGIVGDPVGDPYNVAASTGVDELSDEYTDALLKTNTAAALPAYPGTFLGAGSSCYASATLAGDGSSYTLQRIRFKFGISPAIKTSNYLKIYWTESFQPSADPMTWVNTENSWTHCAGDSSCSADPILVGCTDRTSRTCVDARDPVAPITETDVFELLEGATDGSVFIRNLRWSNDPDYEPVVRYECDPNGSEECSWQNCALDPVL